MKILTEATLRETCPSIYTDHKHGKLTEKYHHFSTARAIETLAGLGWFPFEAKETRVRLEGKQNYQKHIVKFATEEEINSHEGKKTTAERVREGVRAGTLAIGDMVVSNVVLTNGHYGDCALNLEGGISVVACGNGLVVPSSVAAAFHLTHTQLNEDKVIEATFSILKDLPKAAKRLEDFRQVQMTEAEKNDFALKSLETRWAKDAAPIAPAKLLVARRDSDKFDDLYHVFQRVQENLTHGGMPGRKRAVRGLKNIDLELRMNRKLWDLAETFVPQ